MKTSPMTAVPRTRSRPSGGLLSIVIPCHDEEAVIEATHRRLAAALAGCGMDLEMIFIDDGSRDATLAVLERIAAADPRVVVIEFSRNFGQQTAMSAGLARACGDAVVMIDADLQDPPEVIPEMVHRWRTGVDVAYGRRRSREGETRFKLVTASLFHRLFAALVPHEIPVDTGDFKLLDRAVVDAVCSLPEKRRYLRGLVAWAGFRHEPVWYDRQARAAGTTKYSIRRLLKLAGDAVVICSDAPLKAVWGVSAMLAGLGLVATVAAIVSGSLLAGVTAVVTLTAAVQMAAVAVVGEYAARAYREAQGRPTAVTRRVFTQADLPALPADHTQSRAA